MKVNLQAYKKRPAIRDRHSIPDSVEQVDRYRRVQAALEARNIKLHELAREKIDELLTVIESQLESA